ncbi:unnamed protein product, partial [Polarella glacialis]
DRFYDEILDLVTEGRPFGFRLPFVHDGELPVRLRGLLRADPGDECELKWKEAFASLDSASSASQKSRSFCIHFDRSFDDDTWQSWSEWGDGWSQQRTSTSTTAEAIAASVPLAAGNTPQMMLELSGHTLCAARWSWAWSRGQDRMRWGWILGCSVVAAGAGVATMGAALPIVAGVALGATTGIMSSGKRKAHVTVSHAGVSVVCG